MGEENVFYCWAGFELSKLAISGKKNLLPLLVLQVAGFINFLQEDSVLPPVEQLWAWIEEYFVIHEKDGTYEMPSFIKPHWLTSYLNQV